MGEIVGGKFKNVLGSQTRGCLQVSKALNYTYKQKRSIHQDNILTDT